MLYSTYPKRVDTKSEQLYGRVADLALSRAYRQVKRCEELKDSLEILKVFLFRSGVNNNIINKHAAIALVRTENSVYIALCVRQAIAKADRRNYQALQTSMTYDSKPTSMLKFNSKLIEEGGSVDSSNKTGA